MTKCICGASEDSQTCTICASSEEKPEKFSFKKWYEKNKVEIAKKRREKYRDSEEYREYKKTAATRHYWLKQRRAKSIGLNQADYEELELKPEAIVKITISNERDIRYGMTFDVPVFYPRQVAKVLRRNVQTVRLWYLKGLLPEICVIRNKSNYRMVTEDQMRVFAGNRHWLSFEVQDFEQHPFFALVIEGMERLQPDGIEPMLDSDWRVDPTPCPFCNNQTSLQRKVGDKWEYVSCFTCLSPLNVAGRETMKRYRVSGTCVFCRYVLDEEVEAVDGKPLNVGCSRCGRRVQEYQKTEIERG